jgi:hypothetical protein
MLAPELRLSTQHTRTDGSAHSTAQHSTRRKRRPGLRTQDTEHSLWWAQQVFSECIEGVVGHAHRAFIEGWGRRARGWGGQEGVEGVDSTSRACEQGGRDG